MLGLKLIHVSKRGHKALYHCPFVLKIGQYNSRVLVMDIMTLDILTKLLQCHMYMYKHLD